MALIWAIAAAATPADIHSVDSAQNGPFMMYVAVTATQRMAIVGASAPVRPAIARLAASSARGMAVCHLRSPVRSELRPHSSISTEAMPNGMELSRPVWRSVSPKDLMICGCQSDRHWLAPDAPA